MMTGCIISTTTFVTLVFQLHELVLHSELTTSFLWIGLSLTQVLSLVSSGRAACGNVECLHGHCNLLTAGLPNLLKAIVHLHP